MSIPKKANSKKSVKKPDTSFTFLFFGVAATTLYFNTQFLDPFNTPKLIILMFTSAWLIGYLMSTFKDTESAYNNFDSRIIVTISIFFISLIFSLLQTDVLIVGLIGDSQRRNGFLAYIALIVVMLYVYRFANYELIIKLFKFAIFIGFIFACYGILQVVGRDFVQWNNPYNSMISTLGNPNFASALLAVFFLLAASTILIPKFSRSYQYLSVALLVIALFLIIKSNSRQGLITILFGGIFYLTITLLLSKSKIKYFGLGVMFLLTFFTISGMLQSGPMAHFLYKESVSVRGFYWRAAYEMLKAKPFTGVGIDSYGFYFKEFREVEYPLRYGFNLTSTNAHNTILQFFATGGLFVGLSYLAILIMILFIGFNLIKHSTNEMRAVSLGLVSTWVAFQAQSFISIDNIGLAIWGWLLGGGDSRFKI